MMRDEFIPAARFQVLTPLFDTLSSVVGLGKNYRMKIVKSLSIPKGKVQVLDAGCGSGSLAIEVKKKYPQATLYAIDADPAILGIAKRKAIKENRQMPFQKAFLQKLPFADNSFDVVYSSLVFHHLKTELKKEAAREIHRVLKNSGKFVLVDFGKPKYKLFSPFSWFTVLFEEGRDNYKGRIPEILSTAGFRKVKEIGRYRFNVVLVEAVK